MEPTNNYDDLDDDQLSKLVTDILSKHGANVQYLVEENGRENALGLLNAITAAGVEKVVIRNITPAEPTKKPRKPRKQTKA